MPLNETPLIKLMNDSIVTFEKIRSQSYFCKLLLGNRGDIYRNFNGSEEWSLAFLAYYYGYLPKLEDIFRKFNIETNDKNNFKKRLKENWLDETDDMKRLRKFNRVKSSIVELVVADYLSRNKELITKLSALDGSCKGDVESKQEYDNGEYCTEVKYLGEMPDINQLNLRAIRGGNNMAFDSISPPGKIYNYIIWVIANAVSQLEKNNVKLENRRVFVVMDGVLVRSCNIFLDWLDNEEDWFKGENWNTLIANLDTNKNQQEYINNSVKSYLKQTGKFTLSFLNESWDLEERLCKQ